MHRRNLLSQPKGILLVQSTPMQGATPSSHSHDSMTSVWPRLMSIGCRLHPVDINQQATQRSRCHGGSSLPSSTNRIGA